MPGVSCTSNRDSSPSTTERPSAHAGGRFCCQHLRGRLTASAPAARAWSRCRRERRQSRPRHRSSTPHEPDQGTRKRRPTHLSRTHNLHGSLGGRCAPPLRGSQRLPPSAALRLPSGQCQWRSVGSHHRDRSGRSGPIPSRNGRPPGHDERLGGLLSRSLLQQRSGALRALPSGSAQHPNSAHFGREGGRAPPPEPITR